jgi:hypothetical protein
MKALRVELLKPPGWFVDCSALVAVTAFALAIRFHGITVPAIWLDEAFSILLARYEPWDIWSVTARDVHPPLYYLVLHYWIIMFGDGVLAVRSLSAIADVGTVLLSLRLMSLVASRRAIWIAALLLTLLPISVRYSQEVRMYSLLGFWLMGATVALVYWIQEREKVRFPVIYVLLMTAAFYTHYLAALCVLVHWFYWWWGRSGVSQTVLPVRAWLLVNVAIVILFVPWFPNFIEHWTVKPGWIPPVTGQAVLSLVWQLITMNAWGAQSIFFRMVPLGIVTACGLGVIWKDSNQHRYSGLLVGYFFIPAIVLGLISLTVPLFVPRYLVFAAVGLPLVLAVALDKWVRHPGVLALAVVAIMAIEMQGVQSVYRQTDDLNGTDLRRDFRLDVLARELARLVRPDDEIVFESLFWYLPFDYYNQTAIQPRLQVRSPLDTFLAVADRGGYAVIPENLKWIYFDDPEILKCPAHRIWWVTVKSSSNAKGLSAEDWEQTFTFVKGEMAVSLFTLRVNAAPAHTCPPVKSQSNNPCAICG